MILLLVPSQWKVPDLSVPGISWEARTWSEVAQGSFRDFGSFDCLLCFPVHLTEAERSALGGPVMSVFVGPFKDYIRGGGSIIILYPGNAVEKSLKKHRTRVPVDSRLSASSFTSDLASFLLYTVASIRFVEKSIEESIEIQDGYGFLESYVSRHNTGQYIELESDGEDFYGVESIAYYERSHSSIAVRFLLAPGNCLGILPFNQETLCRKDLEALVELTSHLLKNRPKHAPRSEEKEDSENERQYDFSIQIRERNHWVKCLSPKYVIDIELTVTSQREFDFLCALARRPGQVVTKEELKMHIAKRPTYIVEANLSQIRKELRKRFIEHGFPEKHIGKMLGYERQFGYVLYADAEFLPDN